MRRSEEEGQRCDDGEKNRIRKNQRPVEEKEERRGKKHETGFTHNEEEKREKRRTNEEIRGDSHSVLTENRSRRGLLIKRYWILVTLHSICWRPCSCSAAWNPILRG